MNRTAVVPERQVLPRGLDHAVDVARASTHSSGRVLVLDFTNAFMNIPLHPHEMRFNCASVPQGIRLSRPPLDDSEPQEGTFIVWHVLGFGGKPNPLVFARAASFATRSAQALTWSAGAPRSGYAAAYIQTYVDDPAIAPGGTAGSIYLAADVILLWWLILGLPLSWSKGRGLVVLPISPWGGGFILSVSPPPPFSTYRSAFP